MHDAGARRALRSIYQFPGLYGLAMRLSYGREYRERYERLADQITVPSDVLEVCAGDLTLHDHLQQRGLLLSYRGLDESPQMVAHALRRDLQFEIADVRALSAFPPASVVIMQASLYQFHTIAEALVRRLWAAAKRQLVIAEPVRNLSSSTNPIVRSIGRAISRTNAGVHSFRYTERDLVALFHVCEIPITSVGRTSRGREVIVSSVRTETAVDGHRAPGADKRTRRGYPSRSLSETPARLR